MCFHIPDRQTNRRTDKQTKKLIRCGLGNLIGSSRLLKCNSLACLITSFPAIPNIPWFAKFLMHFCMWASNKTTGVRSTHTTSTHNPTHNCHNQHPQPSQAVAKAIPSALMPRAVIGVPTAVVAAPAAAVSIAVATATVSLLPILVDCCLCPRPSLLPPLLLPPTAVAVTVIVFVFILVVTVVVLVVVLIVVV